MSLKYGKTNNEKAFIVLNQLANKYGPKVLQNSILDETITYLVATSELTRDQIDEIINTIVSAPRLREKFMTTAQMIREEGMLEGVRKGLQEGELRGKQEGLQEGKLEGKQEGKLEVARELRRAGMSVEQIAALCHLTREQVEGAK